MVVSVANTEVICSANIAAPFSGPYVFRSSDPSFVKPDTSTNNTAPLDLNTEGAGGRCPTALPNLVLTSVGKNANSADDSLNTPTSSNAVFRLEKNNTDDFREFDAGELFEPIESSDSFRRLMKERIVSGG
jgi:hypothetical protein